MAEEKRIRFSAEGGELTAFMKKLQYDSKAMYDSFANESAKQTKNQKEQYKIIEDQLKASREFLKVQKEITQEKLKQAKSVLSGLGITGEDRAERVAAERKIQRLQNELSGIKNEERGIKGAQGVHRDNRPIEEKEKLSPSIFSEVLKAGLIRDLLSAIRQGGNASNGSELISPAFSITGSVAGAGVGKIIDLISLFATKGKIDPGLSSVFGTIGKEGGGLAGDIITRSFKTREQFDIAYNRYKGLGGRDLANSLTSFGYSSIDVADRMSSVSQAMGSNRDIGRNTALMLFLSRGYNIGEETTLAAFGMQRSGGGNVRTNVQRALGVGIAEGLDRSRFSDAIKTQTVLLQKFSETKTNVSAADATRLMYEFNKMGGMFSIGDARSLANIEKVNSGLSIPNTAFSQAQNYAVLRSLNPNASMWELKKMEEQGIQTPGFLQGIMKQITSSGASIDYQKFIAKSRFGLSGEATDTLFSMWNKTGKIDENKFLSENKIKSEAENLTSRYTKMNSEVVEAFKDDFITGIKTISDQFRSEMTRAIKEIANMALEQENAPFIPIPKGGKVPQRKGYHREKVPTELSGRFGGVDSLDIRNDYQ